MHARKGATRVVIAHFYIFIYIILYASLHILFVLYIISFFFLLLIVFFAPLFRVCIMRACDVAALMYIYSLFMYIYL